MASNITSGRTGFPTSDFSNSLTAVVAAASPSQTKQFATAQRVGALASVLGGAVAGERGRTDFLGRSQNYEEDKDDSDVKTVPGLLYGNGTFTIFSGKELRYEGEWREKGRDTRGNWLTDQKEPHGTGILYDGNQIIYEGELQEGKHHGRGAYYSYEGVYKGQWIKGAQNGWGVYRYPSGDSYEGEWKSGLKHGRGTHHYFNVKVYVGGWVEGKRHGPGKVTYPNGAVLTGVWLEDEWHWKEAVPNWQGGVPPLHGIQDIRHWKEAIEGWKEAIEGWQEAVWEETERHTREASTSAAVAASDES